MSSIIYPDRNSLKQWADALRRPAVFSMEDLPDFNEEWLDNIMMTFDLIKMPHYSEVIHHKGAHLFYKIAKNHHFINGNKRSAVIVLYFFYFINGFAILNNPNEMLDIARATVESDSKENEQEIIKLEKILKNISKKL